MENDIVLLYKRWDSEEETKNKTKDFARIANAFYEKYQSLGRFS